MNMKKLRQEIDALRNEIAPFNTDGMGGNLVSNRFYVIRHGPDDDALVADVHARAHTARERAVVIWVIDPSAKAEVYTA